jgi:hypothetical protein
MPDEGFFFGFPLDGLRIFSHAFAAPANGICNLPGKGLIWIYVPEIGITCFLTGDFPHPVHDFLGINPRAYILHGFSPGKVRGAGNLSEDVELFLGWYIDRHHTPLLKWNVLITQTFVRWLHWVLKQNRTHLKQNGGLKLSESLKQI